MHLFAAFRAFFKVLFSGEEKKVAPAEKKKDQSHLILLRLLQDEGRLLDFLQEDITAYSDEQVGKAIRPVHEGCRKRLEELVTVRPLLEVKEGETFTVPKGYSPSEIKVVGSPSGEAPYSGRVTHCGWKAHKLGLPKGVLASDQILAPAEVEVN